MACQGVPPPPPLVATCGFIVTVLWALSICVFVRFGAAFTCIFDCFGAFGTEFICIFDRFGVEFTFVGRFGAEFTCIFERFGAVGADIVVQCVWCRFWLDFGLNCIGTSQYDPRGLLGRSVGNCGGFWDHFGPMLGLPPAKGKPAIGSRCVL